MGLFDFFRKKEIKSEEVNSSSPGWDAIDNLLKRLYENSVPKHYGSEINKNLGGDNYLEGVSVYKDEVNKFYHYITYGLTELHKKESLDNYISGWGFELTFKLSINDYISEPPKWPINLLQAMAKVIFEQGIELEEFHTLPLGLQIQNSTIDGVLLILDEQLGESKSDFGKFKFLQLFCLDKQDFKNITGKTVDRRAFIKKQKKNNNFLVNILN